MGLGSSGRRIVVEFIGDASNLRSGLRDGEAALSGFSGKAQAAGRIAGKVLAGGLLLAGAAAISATNAAAEDEAAQAQLAQQLRQAANATDAQIASTEDWITTQSLATGIADDQLRPALARLATATGDVGKAQDMLALAMDVSAGTGKSLDTVTTALAKAQNGSISGLSRLGIATKTASGETMTLAQATQAMADKFNGAAANAAATTAGKTQIMRVQFAELQEQIGAQLLPVMMRLAEVGLQVVNWVSQNTTTVGILVAAFGGLLAITWGVGAAMSAYTAIVTLWSGVTKAAAAAQWLLNAAMSANPIGIVVVALAALAAGLVIAYKNSDTFRRIVDAAFSAVRGVVSDVVGWFGKWVPQVFSAVTSAVSSYVNAYRNVVTGAFNAVRGVVGAVADFVVGSARRYGQFASAVIDHVNDVVAFFKNLPGRITGFLSGLPGQLASIGGQIVDGLANGIRAAAGKVMAAVQSLVDKIPKKIRSIMGISSPSKVTTELGKHIGDGLADGLAAKEKKVDEKAKKLVERLKDRLGELKDQFKQLRDSISGAFTGDIFQAENASDFVSGLSAKKGQLGALSAAFKTLAGWGWKPGALAALFQSGNAGLILDLAKNKDLATQGAGLYNDVIGGADALGANVADAMYGKDIDRLQGQIKNAQGGAGNGRIGDTYNVVINGALDPDRVAEQVEKMLRRRERQNGRQLFVSRA